MHRYLCSLVAALSLIGVPSAQTPPQAAPPVPNSHPLYEELRGLAVGGEAYQVSNFVLEKDSATFTLNGTLHLLPPVNGRLTGAVFTGKGSMAYTPPMAVERGMLRILTKGEDFDETFERAVFRFTDDTGEKIRAAGKPASGGSTGDAQNALKDVNQALRFKLRDNLHARILHDVLSAKAGGLFHAYVAGRKYSNKFAYMIDPQGAGFVAPEEIQLFSWADFKEGIFSAHHYRDFYRKKQRTPTSGGTWMDIEHQKLETGIEPSGELAGNATTTFVSLIDGLTAVPFSLFPTLRVSGVTDAAGNPLAFIQEPKDEDADFWVVLAAPLGKGEKLTIRTTYKGKDAVSAEGNDNFFPIARSNWYPNNTGIKDYASYDMTFSVHKRMRLVATGDFVDERVEGDRYISRWKSEYPKSVAGFNLGIFKRDEGTVGDYTVVALANSLASNGTNELLRIAQQFNLPMGSLSTASANKMALSEAQLAVQIFDDYFGPISLKRIHVTQQTACNYGQAWPGVIYIPTCYYWSPAVRQQLGMQQAAGAYWDSVASHEVAHLWWGHALGWNSYRDQWMSEGFSNLSASLFLQAAYPKEPQRFRDFWKDMLSRLTTKNEHGFRPIEAGPLTLGYRLDSGHTGGLTANLVYPKGAYVLHMLRMMMWNREEGDAKFKAMLRDFIASHKNRPVTTEDFKDIVEKHMLPEMNLMGDKSINWFFNQYVYGTELPTYKLQQAVSTKDGQTVLSIKVTQSGVSDAFKMLVPLYVELQDGRVLRLGSATMTGNTTISQEVPVGQIPVKRVLLNHYYDVLSLEEK